MTRRIFLASVTAAGGAGGAFAQLTGAIEGKVEKETGAASPGAAVFLDGQSRQLHLEAKSDSGGRFSFENLTPGRYTLWCELAGYGCIVYPNLVVNSGDRLHRDFHFSGHDGSCET